MAWVLKRSIALGDKKKGRREGILNMKRARREGQRERECARVWPISGVFSVLDTRAMKQQHQEKQRCPKASRAHNRTASTSKGAARESFYL